MSYLLPLESSFPVKDIGRFLCDVHLTAVLRTLSQPKLAAFHGDGAIADISRSLWNSDRVKTYGTCEPANRKIAMF
ncbi:hypothetical protein N7486_009886 [Penicillium sp. IBT 16267x]|nr:hypothetical protein N7486_009886 [Penicillium sp. IBT 16267x]